MKERQKGIILNLAWLASCILLAAMSTLVFGALMDATGLGGQGPIEAIILMVLGVFLVMYIPLAIISLIFTLIQLTVKELCKSRVPFIVLECFKAIPLFFMLLLIVLSMSSNVSDGSVLAVLILGGINVLLCFALDILSVVKYPAKLFGKEKAKNTENTENTENTDQAEPL